MQNSQQTNSLLGKTQTWELCRLHERVVGKSCAVYIGLAKLNSKAQLIERTGYQTRQFFCYRFLFSVCFVRWPWPCTEHKRYWNANATQPVETVGPTHFQEQNSLQGHTLSNFRHWTSEAALYTPFEVCWASQPVSSSNYEQRERQNGYCCDLVSSRCTRSFILPFLLLFKLHYAIRAKGSPVTKDWGLTRTFRLKSIQQSKVMR